VEIATKPRIGWIDIIWLAFLAGLAILPPVNEIHKQLILAGFGIFQLLESRLIGWLPGRGRVYSLLIKTLLATLLLGHTGGIAINSNYYPIIFLPVVTAAIYYGLAGTLAWTAFASLAYCSYLIPALEQYHLTAQGATTLAMRVLFFFLAGILVNRFVQENRKQVVRYQALSEDLAETNRRLIEAQAEARRAERLAALGQLSAGLAHEIRNPLGVIKGSAEMLGRNLGGAPPVAVELAGYISSEVNRLNALIVRFLDFARPSRMELRPVDIAAVADRALDSARTQFPDSPVTVEKRYDANLPPVDADEQLCEQAILNLVVNAYQAIDGRPGTLEFSIAASSNHAGQPGVEITVADTGPGVPEELREQIFNPFVTSKKDGVGLGLAIVAKIVDDHHGTIRLDPSAERGASFRVFLPAAAKV
jgi:two-component system, NtrC family, sensor histidine kinase HydH